MMGKKIGRPSKYKPEMDQQAAKLCRLGATDREVAAFLDTEPSEDAFITACFVLIRQDRRGVIARQKKRRSECRRKRRQNPANRLVEATRARMWAALKGRSDGRLFSRLGYSVNALQTHLEAQFTPGMSWSNYGKWHVDHIKPCAAFDLTDPEQFNECWSLSNLQPLWAAQNVRKGAKYGTP